MQVEISRVMTLCSLLSSLLCGVGDKPLVDFTTDQAKLHPLICTTFVFAYVWSVGGNLVEKSMDAFDTFARDLFSETPDVKVFINFPHQYDLQHYCSLYSIQYVYGLLCRFPVALICMATM